MAGRLHGLEALRGIAALIVLYNHAGFLAGYPDIVSGLFVRGYIAVDLFFMLSGYVLTRTYEGRMGPAQVFLGKRFVRLWPPIAGGVLIGACAGILGGMAPGQLAMGLITGLMMLPLINFAILLNGPAWSIFFELVANFVHAALLQRLAVRHLLTISLICALLLLNPLAERGLNLGQHETFWLGFPRLFMSYALGVVLYRLNRDRTWLPSSWAWGAILAWPVLVAFQAYFMPRPSILALALIANPLVILAALSLKPSRVAVLLGALSFPLYALHYPVMELLAPFAFDWPVVLAIALTASVAGGMAVDSRWRKAVFELADRHHLVRAAAT